MYVRATIEMKIDFNVTFCAMGYESGKYLI